MNRTTYADIDIDRYPCDPLIEPRVIQQFTSIFLVSKCDELWRVYDCGRHDGAGRQMPSDASTARYRLFLALAHKTEVRIHAFDEGASRAIDARALQAQLDRSQTV